MKKNLHLSTGRHGTLTQLSSMFVQCMRKEGFGGKFIAGRIRSDRQIRTRRIKMKRVDGTITFSITANSAVQELHYIPKKVSEIEEMQESLEKIKIRRTLNLQH